MRVIDLFAGAGGFSTGATMAGSKVVLTTAHVYDHRPEACSLLNLAALCQRCHNRHDAKMRAENAKIERMKKK